MSIEADRARFRLQYWIEHDSGRAKLFNLAWDRLLEENKPKAEFCKRGLHPLDEVNTYVYRGERQCRACKALNKRLERGQANATLVSSSIGGITSPDSGNQRYYHSGERESD